MIGCQLSYEVNGLQLSFATISCQFSSEVIGFQMICVAIGSLPVKGLASV